MYYDATKLLNGSPNKGLLYELTYDLLIFAFYSIEIYSIIWVSNAVNKEVWVKYKISIYHICTMIIYLLQAADTGEILYEVLIDVDERLNQAVSVKTFQLTIKITREIIV